MTLRKDRLLCGIINSCAPCRRASWVTQIVIPHPNRGGCERQPGTHRRQIRQVRLSQIKQGGCNIVTCQFGLECSASLRAKQVLAHKDVLLGGCTYSFLCMRHTRSERRYDGAPHSGLRRWSRHDGTPSPASGSVQALSSYLHTPGGDTLTGSQAPVACERESCPS